MKTKINEQTPQSEEFQNLVNLLAVYTEASNRLAHLQADANNQLLDVLDEIKAEYAQNQEAMARAEAAMEQIALKHPEWFSTKRSIKTPFGTVKLHSATKLAIANEEAALARLEREAYARFPGSSEEAKAERAEFLSKYTRVEVALNKESLELESDSFLNLLGIQRVTEDKFSAKPATIDLGKAISESAADTQQEAA